MYVQRVKCLSACVLPVCQEHKIAPISSIDSALQGRLQANSTYGVKTLRTSVVFMNDQPLEVDNSRPARGAICKEGTSASAASLFFTQSFECTLLAGPLCGPEDTASSGYLLPLQLSGYLLLSGVCVPLYVSFWPISLGLSVSLYQACCIRLEGSLGFLICCKVSTLVSLSSSSSLSVCSAVASSFECLPQVAFSSFFAS